MGSSDEPIFEKMQNSHLKANFAEVIRANIPHLDFIRSFEPPFDHVTYYKYDTALGIEGYDRAADCLKINLILFQNGLQFVGDEQKRIYKKFLHTTLDTIMQERIFDHEIFNKKKTYVNKNQIKILENDIIEAQYTYPHKSEEEKVCKITMMVNLVQKTAPKDDDFAKAHVPEALK